MRALVTGGAGFLGSHVVDMLLAEGHEVGIIDDLSGGFNRNVNPYARLFRASVADDVLVDRIFSESNFDYVYHLAAYAAEGLSHFIRRYNYETNLLGSINIINAAIKYRVKCIVFTSSIAVYGAGQTPMTEEQVPHPEDPYGIAKYAVELDLAAARQQFGLDYVIFRPHNVYGERQNTADMYRNVIGIFMNQVLRSEPLTIFGDGLQTRAFTHVSDVTSTIVRSPLVPAALGETFNIGADKPYRVIDLANAVQEAMGNWTGYSLLPARNEVRHAYASHAKCRRVFGEISSTSLTEGLSRMTAWVKAVGVQQGTPFTNIEIDRDLPSVWEVVR